jgi:antitoxin (DNA-binding transcriptional repressor) of toxin-antitoxin stability system
MRALSITVTEAARNFADCVNRVHYQGASFVLRKNGVAVARLVPAESKPGTDSAGAYPQVQKTVTPQEGEPEKLPSAADQVRESAQPPQVHKRQTLNW